MLPLRNASKGIYSESPRSFSQYLPASVLNVVYLPPPIPLLPSPGCWSAGAAGAPCGARPCDAAGVRGAGWCSAGHHGWSVMRLMMRGPNDCLPTTCQQCLVLVQNTVAGWNFGRRMVQRADQAAVPDTTMLARNRNSTLSEPASGRLPNLLYPRSSICGLKSPRETASLCMGHRSLSMS